MDSEKPGKSSGAKEQLVSHIFRESIKHPDQLIKGPFRSIPSAISWERAQIGRARVTLHPAFFVSGQVINNRQVHYQSHTILVRVDLSWAVLFPSWSWTLARRLPPHPASPWLGQGAFAHRGNYCHHPLNIYLLVFEALGIFSKS